jgi:hypothetical protein
MRGLRGVVEGIAETNAGRVESGFQNSEAHHSYDAGTGSLSYFMIVT